MTNNGIPRLTAEPLWRATEKIPEDCVVPAVFLSVHLAIMRWPTEQLSERGFVDITEGATVYMIDNGALSGDAHVQCLRRGWTVEQSHSMRLSRSTDVYAEVNVIDDDDNNGESADIAAIEEATFLGAKSAERLLDDPERALEAAESAIETGRTEIAQKAS
ncbi:MAG TPA: hypothetical protein VJ865_03525 [Gemmatimonadaceae bacterium]|nr:hypothetical protein [Gemmatimonadaceae bacterium]